MSEKIIKNTSDLEEAAAAASAVNGTFASDGEPRRDKKHYRVTNWSIIKNYPHYTPEERKHYTYIFWRRVGGWIWPIFRAVLIFGLAFVILYPIMYMISASVRRRKFMIRR